MEHCPTCNLQYKRYINVRQRVKIFPHSCERKNVRKRVKIIPHLRERKIVKQW